MPQRCRDLGFDGRRTVDETRVLIVDADHEGCGRVAGMIHLIGLETAFACSKSHALAIADEFLPGFVLLNTDQAHLECYRLASMLHKRAVLCDARLIALTAEIVSTDRRAALAAGFEQFLTLPLQQGALQSVLTGRSHRGPSRSHALRHRS
jgi:CheY-like chemotaxis protein